MKKPGVEELEALLQIFEASPYTELHFEADGFELMLSDDPDTVRTGETPVAERAGSTAQVAPPASATAQTVSPKPATQQDDLSGLVALTAPSLGHFYRSPKPGAPPFVEIGQNVDVHDVVCVIEVMKLFTLLEAGRSGIVRRICVEDGALVEFEQPLLYLEPAP